MPGSAPIDSRPTRGLVMPNATSAYAEPSCANCASISGLGSAMAPASMSSVGVGLVGSATASAGRSTPVRLRSRSLAIDTIAAVEPADITALAWPR